MIVALVDTNVLVSGFARCDQASPPTQILDAWRERLFVLVVSEHILAEVSQAFEEPYFAGRLTSADRVANVALLRDEAIVTPISVNVRGVATHPEDDLILAAAVSADADYLVTGDAKLQEVTKHQGVTVVSPREFLEMLGKQASG